MTPVAHTIYSVGLFFSLLALLLWLKRRHRVSEMVKRAVSDIARQDRA